ncbi:MAG: RT0821/Lpp0805 family surface protein [Oceanibaculum nanhaiense]|uniref:RT0821/Lpp0805 family surface protein n=1 Tax=Oceanibaculum nanhaiense TaxID=1909734 RepID=UPI0025A3A20C|nr:RT0821/Lpp0805 family surface protein [Oceanibaculum nanhaiense]MDM7946552.1 RT0821/Lpp0805 family surface protein [Oceanibaculum nanhaiense]
MMKKTAIALSALLLLAACENGNHENKQTAGTILGGIAGAVAGSQIGGGKGRLAAVAAGALLGGFLGNQIGSDLDEVDRQRANSAMNRAQAAPVGQTITWNNPNSGNSGSVTPVREGTTASGEYCREFQQTVIIGGKSENAYGTACRQPDGSWKIVE